jgi:hypothetical protein
MGGGDQLILVSAVQEKLFFVDVNGLVYSEEGGGERLETAFIAVVKNDIYCGEKFKFY